MRRWLLATPHARPSHRAAPAKRCGAGASPSCLGTAVCLPAVLEHEHDGSACTPALHPF